MKILKRITLILLVDALFARLIEQPKPPEQK